MPEELRTTLIDGYTRGLVASFGGVSPPVAPEELRRMFAKKDFTAMAGYIRDSMRLQGLPLRIGYVKSGGKNAEDLGWVEEEVPLYGTAEFRKNQVTVYLRNSFLQTAPFESIVCHMAHELSHIVLCSLRHPLQYEEEAADLTAMILGYRNFYRVGTKYIKAVYRDRSKPFFHRIVSYWKLIVGRIDDVERRKLGYLTNKEIAYAANALDRLALRK